MPQEPTPPNDSLIPSQPIPAGAQELSKRVGGLLDGQPKDDRTVAQALEGMDDIVELMAAGMYNMASMLVGEGEDSALLVEAAISTAKISPCAGAVAGAVCRVSGAAGCGAGRLSVEGAVAGC